jgi:HD superfamily phosphodiesterase
MNEVYQQIWNIAKPLYQMARPMDIDHIEWFIEIASMVCVEEGLDDSILLPFSILHDVGYSRIPDIHDANYFGLDVRRAHMDEGGRIAIEILEQVKYPPEKIQKIAEYISVHDNWAFGELDLYLSDPVLSTFKDLDYLWTYTEKGSIAIQEKLGLSNAEMLERLRGEKSPIFGRKPFANITTRKLHDQYMLERELNLRISPPSKEIR